MKTIKKNWCTVYKNSKEIMQKYCGIKKRKSYFRSLYFCKGKICQITYFDKNQKEIKIYKL
jgi:hypothetical protein